MGRPLYVLSWIIVPIVLIFAFGFIICWLYGIPPFGSWPLTKEQQIEQQKKAKRREIWRLTFFMLLGVTSREVEKGISTATDFGKKLTQNAADNLSKPA